MFNKLLVVLAVATSLTAHAENWQTIQDAASGGRLIVDTDSVAVDTYDKTDNTKSTRIYAGMQIIGGNETSEPFYAIIDAVECMTKGNGILLTKYSDKKMQTYFWDTNGTKVYDSAGQWLCGYTQGLLDLAAKNKNKDKKKISM